MLWPSAADFHYRFFRNGSFFRKGSALAEPSGLKNIWASAPEGGGSQRPLLQRLRRAALPWKGAASSRAVQRKNDLGFSTW